MYEKDVTFNKGHYDTNPTPFQTNLSKEADKRHEQKNQAQKVKNITFKKNFQPENHTFNRRVRGSVSINNESTVPEAYKGLVESF